MSDLISRQAAIEAECEVCQIAPKKERGHNCTYYVHGCKEIECLRALPSAERKRGRWVPQEDEEGYPLGCACSECGKSYVMPEGLAYYCPNCGADMRGKEG